jgi:lysyl-tRNA synthetase class 2
MKTISDIIALLREFFILHGFNEVVTPQVIPAPVPEPYIDLFKVPDGYKRPSPEIEMKILLAEGAEKIFQIGPCFRRDEVGRHHKEEFTMLEWYEVGADYNDTLRLTQKMLLFLSERLSNSSTIQYDDREIDLAPPWTVYTVEDAFLEFANIAPETAIKEDRFEDILVETVEPALLKINTPVILKDYPAKFAALAKLKQENSTVAERWELYIAGIELANTYTELTDYEENRSRFAKFAEERKMLNKEEIPVSKTFFNALKKGIPECSGCAMGVDRLTMILNNQRAI